MTATVRVEAPEVTRTRRVAVRQTARGWVLSHLAARVLSIWPLALIERAFGVGGPAWRQLVILPVSLALGAGWWAVTARYAPGRDRGDRLVVSPGELTVAGPSRPADVVGRAEVGLVEVTAGARAGDLTLVVYDRSSRALRTWRGQWAGWNPEKLAGVLRRAGYPAAPRNRIYDGAFRHQSEGHQPRAAAGLGVFD